MSSEESLVGLVERHAHPEDLLAVHELERAALAGQPREVEIRILGGDGVERWISWRSVPRRVDGALLVDGVATDVSSRHSLGRSRRDLEEANEEYARQVDLRRRHALAVRDANDNVLQRIFAAGLRLQILRRKLDDVEAHAASTIAFQLDQAATDLRELILDLNAVIGDLPDSGRPGAEPPTQVGGARPLEPGHHDAARARRDRDVVGHHDDEAAGGLGGGGAGGGVLDRHAAAGSTPSSSARAQVGLGVGLAVA